MGMNLFVRPIVPGLFIPDAYSEYVIISLEALASHSGVSVAEVCAHIESFNEEG